MEAEDYLKNELTARNLWSVETDDSYQAVAEIMEDYNQSRISQLEQDLAKSQEKRKAYEGALEEISVKRIMHPEYGFINIAESCIQVAEQALKQNKDAN